MGGPRQPIELVIANGKKHLTKEQIRKRRNSEVQAFTDDIIAPDFLTSKQKKEFYRISEQLQKLKIMGETDCDTLARYIVSQDLYAVAVKELRNIQTLRPKKSGEQVTDLENMVNWTSMLEKLDKRVDRYFKQATSAASKLGLTISDRCKLVVPIKDEAPKANKFVKFSKADDE